MFWTTGLWRVRMRWTTQRHMTEIQILILSYSTVLLIKQVFAFMIKRSWVLWNSMNYGSVKRTSVNFWCLHLINSDSVLTFRRSIMHLSSGSMWVGWMNLYKCVGLWSKKARGREWKLWCPVSTNKNISPGKFLNDGNCSFFLWVT
jgi:hypothetical protein